MSSIPVIDLHCDILSKSLRVFRKGLMVTPERLKKGNVKAQILAIFVNPAIKNQSKVVFREISIFQKLVERHEETLEYVINIKDIDKVYKKGKTALLLAIEGANILRNLEDLRFFANIGIVYLTITWNHHNRWGDAAKPKIPEHNGLSNDGKKLIREMEKYGILPDVSHCSEKTFYDIIENTDGPVIASHSNTYKIFNHFRNLKTRQIKEIAKKGGIIGINFYCGFLNGKKICTIDNVIEHIKFIADTGGIDVVGIGSDFDGITTVPEGLESPEKYPILGEKLLKNGFSEEDVGKIFYKNALRVLKKTKIVRK